MADKPIKARLTIVVECTEPLSPDDLETIDHTLDNLRGFGRIEIADLWQAEQKRSLR